MDLFKTAKKNKKFLILIFCLSLVLNFLFFHFFLKQNKDYWRGDTPWYDEIAVQIANGNGIKTFDGIDSYYRVPGYSIFLAACYKIFNFDKISAILIQIILSAFIPILIFFLSICLFPSNLLLAKLSSFLFCFNFGNWLYSGVLMSESIFLLLFLIFLILFLKGIK
ncbi:hypothetical protein GF385_01905, partial [Candidatus Dependentiae bacterium]|nr:hypothetical protein [Candidatus Dependentiae bacterium]